MMDYRFLQDWMTSQNQFTDLQTREPFQSFGINLSIAADGTGDFLNLVDAYSFINTLPFNKQQTYTMAPGVYSHGTAIQFLSPMNDSIIGDSRAIVGLSYVDNAEANPQGITNGGSGTCSLSNAGANLTISCAGSQPNFATAGLVSGDRILVKNNAGVIAEYTISSASGNILTLTTTAPTVGNTGSTVTICPNVIIEDRIIAQGGGYLALDGLYLKPPNSVGVLANYGTAISVRNCVVYGAGLASTGFQSQWGTLVSLDGPNTVIDVTTFGFIAHVGGRLNASQGGQAAIVTNRGFLAQYNSVVYLPAACWSVNNGLQGYIASTGSTLRAEGCNAINCNIGYTAQTGAYLDAANTSAKNQGNTTNYSPAVSATQGNIFGTITFS